MILHICISAQGGHFYAISIISSLIRLENILHSISAVWLYIIEHVCKRKAVQVTKSEMFEACKHCYQTKIEQCFRD